MTETLQKLEPHRTVSIRGFDRRGAAAAMHHASAAGFQLSGVFRDMADFCVVVLHDADDYFGHYSTTKYLPDFDFTGMVLSFDLLTSGTQRIDSPAFQWIPWRSLSYVLENGTRGAIDLASHISYVSGARAKASTTLTISASAVYGDRVTAWYQNIAFDYIVPGGLGSTATYFFQLPGTTASINVDSTVYTYSVTTPGGESGATIAAGVAAAAAGDPLVAFSAAGNVVSFSPRANTGAQVNVLGYALWVITDPPSDFVTANLAAQVNGFDWTGYTLPLTATAAGNVLTITCAVYGPDGNSITLYSIYSGSSSIAPNVAPLTGGASSAKWHVQIDFSALGINHLRQCWMTIAPQLTSGTVYADTEWTYTFSNWSVTDPNGKRPLKIAGKGSVRVGSRDVWAAYRGTSWVEEASNQPGGTGWFYRGYARRMSVPGNSVTVQYSCQSSHDLYLGTSLYSDRGQVLVRVDGAAAQTLDCYLDEANPTVTRRKAWPTTLAAGTHTVEITLDYFHNTHSSGYFFYFDYLEAAVASDVVDPAISYPNVMPATDFDTDHCYKLPPQRLVWMLDRLGFAGSLDHYLGVFWWNQRKRVGGTFPSVTVTFGGTWAGGDAAFISISGSAIGKSVFPADTNDTIAAHFAYFVNSTFTGVRASATGPVLTITCRTPEFSFTFATANTTAAGTMTTTGNLNSGIEGTWVIDDTATPVVNRAVTDWHADLFSEVHTKSWKAAAAFSMELVNPPEATGAVYAQRFADGTPVATDTGFSSLKSTQCTFNATFRAYQQQAYKEMAGLMSTAGLTPWLQFGEFLWWFFDWYIDGTGTLVDAGMAFYDADTSAAAAAALGRPLATFAATTDSPAINSHADANFLRGLIYAHTSAIRAHVLASYPTAKFEVLWPYDVNYPTLTKIAKLGGQLNRYVNLPSQWETKSGSGLDRFKTEALAFGATERNQDQARETITFARTAPLDWPTADTAYLIPIFNGGCAWLREYLSAVNAKAPLVNLWAFDHLSLLSWPIPLPANQASIDAR